MLISKKKKAFANHHSLLCASTKVVGDVYFSGDFYLEGTIKGNLYAEEGKPSKLVIAETGKVEGDVYVTNALINGHVRGTIYSTKHVELAAKAVVEGCIHYNSIEMVRGSQLIGQMLHKGENAPKTNEQAAQPVHVELVVNS